MPAARCRTLPLRPAVPTTTARWPLSQSLGALPVTVLLCVALAAGFFGPAPTSLQHAPMRAEAYYVSEEGYVIDGAVEMTSLRVAQTITINQVDVGSLLAALQSQLAAMAADQSAAAANATALQATVAALTARSAAQAVQIAALQAANSTITADAAALTSRVTGAEDAATALNTRVGAAEGSIGTHSTQIASLQSANTTITNAATALTTRVSNAEGLTGGTALATTVGTLQAYAPCCGRTAPGSTAWIYYSELGGVEVDVNISSCGFAAGTMPLITTSVGGSGSHWVTTGGTSVYPAQSGAPPHQAFRILLFPFAFSTTDVNTPLMPQILTLAAVNSYQWHVNWCARRV